MGGIQTSSGNSAGVGGYFSGQKMEIPGRWGGGSLCEIPSVVGVWIFSGTTHSRKVSTQNFVIILCDITGFENFLFSFSQS